MKVLSDSYRENFEFKVQGCMLAQVSFHDDSEETIEIEATLSLSQAKDLAKWILSLEDQILIYLKIKADIDNQWVDVSFRLDDMQYFRKFSDKTMIYLFGGIRFIADETFESFTKKIERLHK